MHPDLHLPHSGPCCATPDVLDVDAIVRQAALFDGVADDAVLAIQECLHYKTFSRGDAVYTEGDPGSELFIIVSGKAKISRACVDRRETVLAIVGPSDMFGELSLFDPGPRLATARAMTDLSVGVLANSSLRPWIEERPEIAMQLMRLIARRLRRTNDTISDLIFTDVPARVAKALVELARRFGVSDPDGVRVDHDLKQDELSQLVGASRETVNKVLSDFTSRGWITLGRQSVTILDEARLIRRAHPTAGFARQASPPLQSVDASRHR
jgi:CRP/FNR family cyclic AMP-dependent transcriptional regulator